MLNYGYDEKDSVKRVERVGDSVLILGESLDIMKDFPDSSIDAIVTDPPYGMNFISNYRKIKHKAIKNDGALPLEHIKESMRIANRCAYYFCRWDNLYDMPKPKSVLTWVKNNWSMGNLEHEHGRAWEACCFYAMENHEFIKRIPDVIFAKKTGNNFHPTEKPVDLMARIIKSNVADTIFDPFMGSGTTGIAALKENRKFIGIEVDELHFEVALKRMRDFHSQPTLGFDTKDTKQEEKELQTEIQFRFG